jgi:hypothetical protein
MTMFGPPLSRAVVARRLAVVTTAGACAAGALTGCGSGGHTPARASSSAAATGAARSVATMHELVRCIRRHGAPTFPDMVFDQRSQSWVMPAGASKPPPSAVNPCRSIMNRMPQRGDERPVTAADLAKLRQLSQCMRQHGIPDWPDPNGDGALPLPPRIRTGGKTMFRSQLQACRQYFPADGLRVTRGNTSGS